MQRIANIYPKITAFDNLYAAWRKARRGKLGRYEVAEFSLNLESELLELQLQLETGDYLPGKYRLFTIYERKPRLIAAAPFRDRVVHHAIMNQLEPLLDRTFIYDSYACRRGKGVHQAVRRYQAWAGRYTYVLKMDVESYFPSVDQSRLKEKLRRRIKDKRTLALLDQIIDGGPRFPNRPAVWFPGDDLLTPLERSKGIPIGNLCSQFFANLYLNDLDHRIKEVFGVHAYLRYVDDMVALDDDSGRLRELRAATTEWLQQDRLQLHPRKAEISRVRDGLDLLGYRVFPDFLLLRNDNGHRFNRALRRLAKSYSKGRVGWNEINPRVQSWIGHARQADSWYLRERIFSSILFTRGTNHEVSV